MDNATTIYTLNAEAAAALLRDHLTTAAPPDTGAALKLRKHQPPSKILEYRTLPYERRMWAPGVVLDFCRCHQPPRMRMAFACLAALERAAEEYSDATATHTAKGRAQSLVREVLAKILAAGDEP